jgi:hypothetical protein
VLLRGFVASVESAFRRRALIAAAWDAALPLLCVVALALLWSKQLAAWLLLAAAVVVGVRLVPALLRARAAARSALLELQRAPRHLGDGLATWREVDGGGTGDSPMARWLAADLGQQVRAFAAAQTAPLRGRKLGRVRYLAPLLAVLLLVWWLRPDLSLPVPGLGSSPAGGSGGAGHGGGAGRVAAQPLPPPPQPEPEPEPEPGPDSPPAPPAPLLDVPAVPNVVVPEFTDDGPTRRALAHRALATVDDAAAAPAAAGAGGGQQPGPPPKKEQFERAAERAQASRHVPPAERDFVRRYFALLQEQAK